MRVTDFRSHADPIRGRIAGTQLLKKRTFVVGLKAWILWLKKTQLKLEITFLAVKTCYKQWWVILSCKTFVLVWKGRTEKPESGIRNRSRKRKRNRNRNRILNWGQGKLGSTETSSDTRVEIKFNMASSVIIVLRNFQHSDRDTKDILTFGKWLAKKKKVSASYCYS